MIPEIGTRLRLLDGGGPSWLPVTIWELVESRAADAPGTQERPSYERHTLRAVGQTNPENGKAWKLGSEMHVEDAWFRERRWLRVDKV